MIVKWQNKYYIIIVQPYEGRTTTFNSTNVKPNMSQNYTNFFERKRKMNINVFDSWKWDTCRLGNLTKQILMMSNEIANKRMPSKLKRPIECKIILLLRTIK